MSAATQNKPVEHQAELTSILKEELSKEELRDLMALRDKFKTKYLEVYPESLDKGAGQAERAFFETFGIADVENEYQSTQTNLKTYRLANGGKMGDEKRYIQRYFRDYSIPEKRQLQLMSVLRATGWLDNPERAMHALALDNIRQMVDTGFLTTDAAVTAFIDNFPAQQGFKEGEMTLRLAMDYAEFYGDDPKKISAFFLALNDKDAVLALNRLHNLRPALEGDLNHLLYWVEAVKNNSRKGNTLALAFLQPETIELVSRVLPDYKERSRFLNTVFYSLPDTPMSTVILQEYMLDALEAPGSNPNYQTQELAKPVINSAENFYKHVAHSCLDLNHLFVERGKNQGTHLVGERSSSFNKKAFLQVFHLVAVLVDRDSYVKFSGDHMPGSVSELAKRVKEQGGDTEMLKAN